MRSFLTFCLLLSKVKASSSTKAPVTTAFRLELRYKTPKWATLKKNSRCQHWDYYNQSKKVITTKTHSNEWEEVSQLQKILLIQLNSFIVEEDCRLQKPNLGPVGTKKCTIINTGKPKSSISKRCRSQTPLATDLEWSPRRWTTITWSQILVVKQWARTLVKN